MHPNESDLALYAGRELGLWPRWRLRAHLRACERCTRHVEEYGAVREWVSSQGDELPRGVHWNALAAEMKANIRLGLAAGAIVATPPPERVPLGWRRPALVLPVLLVVIAGVILQSFRPPMKHSVPDSQRLVAETGVVLDATSTSIGMEQGGRGLKLIYPRGENVFYSVRGQGAVRARYVDADTGQVTISHVYAQ